MKIIHINNYKGRCIKMSLEILTEKLASESKREYTIQESERLARDVLEACGYGELIGATPIVKIAHSFGFSCLAVDNMPDDISGNIFVGGTTNQIYHRDRVIVVEKNEELGHQRFIIAHELAHYLIDYLGSVESQNPNLLFSRTYPKQNHDSEEEMRADRFAAELLMPAKSFLKQYIKAMEAFDYDKKYVVLYLANFFKTKETSIERRIDEVIL